MSRFVVPMRTNSGIVSALSCIAVALGIGSNGSADDSAPRPDVRKIEDPPPARRMLPAAALDTKRNRMLVFGGTDQDNSGPERDLLSFDIKKESWTLEKPTGPAPSGVFGPAMVYAPGEDAVYVFGGWARGAPKPLAELWKLRLGVKEPRQWRRVTDRSSGPPARNGCCMVLDAKHNRIIVHGGDGGPNAGIGYTPLDDLWAFDLGSGRWRRLDAGGDVPQPRWNHAATYDVKRGTMYVFGGAGYVGDREVRDRDVFALELDKLIWKKLDARGRPPPEMLGTSLTYDESYDALLVVGGLSLAASGPAGPKTLWTLDIASRTWLRFKDKLPESRRGHVAIYDPDSKCHVIYGGQTVAERGNFYTRGSALKDALIVRLSKNGQ